MSYKYYLFDADNTLLDFDRSAREAFSETLAHLEIEEKFWHYPKYVAINRECWAHLEKGLISPEEVKSVRYERFLELINHPASGKETGHYYLDALSRKSYLESGAIELLKELQEKDVTLCMITNGLSTVQRPRIKDSGLDQFFPTVVISEEIGFAKPMPGFFEFTLKELEEPNRREILIIGDTPGSDILGGQHMELDTCWYNPKGNSFPFDPGPTHEVRDLDAILNLRPSFL